MDNSLKGYVFRFIRLILGIIIGAVGVAFSVNANLGLSPWTVLAQGISFKLSSILGVNIMLGTITQVIGIIILILVVLLKETIGIGTIFDIVIFGLFMNIVLGSNIIPTPDSFILRLAMCIFGLIILGFSVYFYMSAALGAGPRDSLMAALAKRNISVAMAKTVTEGAALLVGFLLGGAVGIGTIISVCSLGFIIKFFFKFFRLDIVNLHNDSLIDTAINIKSILFKAKVS